MAIIRGLMRSKRCAAIVLWVALGGVGCGSSPTEPVGPSSPGVINLTVETPPVISDAGQLTLTSSVCGCSMSPLIVAVNGAVVGNLPCSAQRQFPMPRMEAGTVSYRILVTNGVGTSGLVSFDVSSDRPGAPSLAVRAFCP